MLELILRNGSKFQDGFKAARWLGGVGHVEVYHNGRVYLHLYRPSRSIELHGFQAAMVRGIMAMQA